jgi:membrane-bound ClpP family serine protease
MGATAEARTELNPGGTVFLKGELWDAVAEEGPIRAGETVQVVAMEGFRLRVKRLNQVQRTS